MSTELVTFLTTCAAIEQECAQLYRWFSELYRDDRQASRLWKKTELEENNHESQLLLAAKLAEELPAVPLLEQAEAEWKLQLVRSLRQELGNEPPGLARALELAIAIEEELAVFHLENVLHFEREEHRKMFEAMMAHDREHADALSKFLDELKAGGSAG